MNKQENVDNLLPDRILNFIRSQSLVTLATSLNNIPHCAICYYAYSENLGGLIFKSSAQSRHVQEGIINPRVAAGVSQTESDINKIRGIQAEGTFVELNDTQIAEAKRTYYKKFPFALAIPGDLWLLELTNIKFVDNSLGFSKKMYWVKDN